jgi:hypothetical protein
MSSLTLAARSMLNSIRDFLTATSRRRPHRRRPPCDPAHHRRAAGRGGAHRRESTPERAVAHAVREFDPTREANRLIDLAEAEGNSDQLLPVIAIHSRNRQSGSS